MNRHALRLALPILATATFALSTPSYAAQWNTARVQALTGDYNGDGQPDIYLKPHKGLVMIGVEQPLPLVLTPPFPPVVLLKNGASYTHLYNPPLSELNKVSWQTLPYDLHTADLNGDGLADLILQPQHSGQDLILVSGQPETQGLLAIKNSAELGIEIASTAGAVISTVDLNKDGRTDLVINVNSQIEKKLISLQVNGTYSLSPESSQDIDVITDTAIAANAFGISEGTASITNSGQFSYTYEIESPDGVNGLAPKLSINHIGNGVDGLIGKGWALSGISNIHRCTSSVAHHGSSGVPAGLKSDQLCIDGQPLILISGTHFTSGARYSTAMQSHTRIEIKGNDASLHFEAKNKDGSVLLFGATSNSRETGIGSNVVTSWHISSTKDPHGNEITYEHYNEDGWVRPKSIVYAGAEVLFEYKTKLSAHAEYRAGGKRIVKHLLSKIATKAPDGSEKNIFNLGYEQSKLESAKLIFIQHCAKQAGTTQCLKENQLNYISQPTLIEPSSRSNATKSLSSFVDGEDFTLDWNGDGFADLASVHTQSITISLGGKTGLSENKVNPVHYGNGGFTSMGGKRLLSSTSADYNQDGAAEIIYLLGEEVTKDRINLSWHIVGTTTPDTVIVSWEDSSDVVMGLDSSFDGLISLSAGGRLSAIKPITLDYDHNGLPDFILPKSREWKLFVNTGNGPTFSASQSISNIKYGKEGISWAIPLSASSDGTWQFLTTIIKDGTSNYATWSVPKTGVSSLSKKDLGIPVKKSVLLDMNGDGNIDIVAPSSDGNVYAYHNKGLTGDTLNFDKIDTALPNKIFGDDLFRTTIDDYIPRTINYDGDNKQDLLFIDDIKGEYAVLRSTGSSFVKLSTGIPVKRSTEYLGNEGLAPFFNTDCKQYRDMLRGTLKSMASNDFERLSAGFFIAALDDACKYIPSEPLTRPEHSLVNDFNGDGQDDLLLLTQVGGEYYWQNHLQKRTHSELLSSVVDSLGNTTQAEYSNTLDTSVYTGTGTVQFPEIALKGTLPLVKKLTISNGATGPRNTEYRYAGGKFNLLGYGFLGFAEQTTVDLEKGIINTVQFNQLHPLTGTVSGQEQRLGNRLLSRTSTQYFTLQDAPRKIFFVAPKDSLHETFELDGQPINATRTELEYDSVSGDVKNKTTTIMGKAGGAPLERTTEKFTYQHNEAEWLLGFPSRVAVTQQRAGNPEITRVTTRTQLPNTLLTKTESVHEGIGHLQLTKTYAYNSRGQLERETYSSATGTFSVQLADYAYSRYPQRITNPLGHVSLTEYSASGLPIKKTDPNGVFTAYSYDAFGRLSQEQSADGTLVRHAYTGCMLICLPNEAYRVSRETTHVGQAGQGAPKQRAHYDSLGRELRSVTQGFDGSEIYVDTRYDALGRVKSKSLPYKAGSAQLLTQYTYDELDRPLQVLLPNGPIVTHSVVGSATGGYVQSKRRQFQRDGAPVNQLEVRHYDATARLTRSVNAANSALSTFIDYDYDSAGNLLSTQINGNPRTKIVMRYDEAGNRISQHDPNTGLIAYTYNALGQVTEIQNATAIIKQQHDFLGRLVSREDYEGTTLVDSARWQYDQGSHALGKLSGYYKNDNSFVQGYVYDSLSRLAARATDIAVDGVNKHYQVGYSYDVYSRSQLTTWSSGAAIKQHYNTYGYLEGEGSADDTVRYRTIEGQNALGKPTRVRYGNGVVSDLGYDDTQTWLTAIDSQAADGTSIQRLQYRIDPIGLLTQRQDLRAQLSETFTYDELQRLSTGQRQLAGGVTQLDNYHYDALGNMVHTPALGSVNYATYSEAGRSACDALSAITQPGPHAPLESTQGAYCYDARGNQISGPQRQVTYSPDNKPLRIISRGQESRFHYDPERKRFYQHSPSRTTYYMDEGQLEEIATPTQSTLNTYVASYLQHKKDQLTGNVQLLYKLHDPLGSVDVVLNEQGAVLERLAYAPFGGLRGADWSDNAASMQQSRRGYTGHEHLEESQLIHMNGRVYDPALTRFLSADIVYQDTANAQLYGRYAYAYNSPFSGTDPSGYTFKDFMNQQLSGMRAFYDLGKSFISNPFKTLLPSGHNVYSNGSQGATFSSTAFGFGKGLGNLAIGLGQQLYNNSLPGMATTIAYKPLTFPTLGELAPNEQVGGAFFEVAQFLVPASKVAAPAVSISTKLNTPLVSQTFGKLRNAQPNLERPDFYSSGSFSIVPKKTGYGPNDPPVRIGGDWSINDMKAALLGHPPKGLGKPDLHHADQMPGSAIHEILPEVHRGNKSLHPNKFNQGVTPEMRDADRKLHWWYRAREQGADDALPNWIYD
ncbi:RHS repeat-associated core domain-containing protein [Atopomonas hussainii]|uniref:RHS repeat-associated core domain-containing protein n=1 Tax=Atopomonas hussainii TaxID=1429083 RepID=UPI0009001713|nr:RHS repeat-associated core domain-containing protein [Atopomonas hussainii]